MKKNLLAILLFTFFSANAQVGIGTNTPNASAKLDITSTNKGLLPPRVALTGTTDVTTIASPATALLVYNTATAGVSPNNVVPGYYYYNGSNWVNLITPSSLATAIDVNGYNVTPSNSGGIYIQLFNLSPAFPEDLPDGFRYTVVNSTNGGRTTNTLSTTKFYTTANPGSGVSQITVKAGGTVMVHVITAAGVKKYHVTGDFN